MVTKRLNIENRTYYFYNDNINWSWLLLHWLCHKKTEYNVNSVNPLYLIINRIDGFIEEKNGDKYLNTASTDRNSEVLKSIQKFGMELKIAYKK